MNMHKNFEDNKYIKKDEVTNINKKNIDSYDVLTHVTKRYLYLNVEKSNGSKVSYSLC